MIFEADFRHAIKNEYIPFLAKLINEELTDRERFELIQKIFEEMDSTYKHQFLEQYM